MKVIRILLVDDEPQIVRFLLPALTASGYEVQTAKTGNEALQFIKNTPPDVVLLDLGLPDIDGKNVLWKVRSYSKIPIIVLSARAEESEKIQALDAGADDYVEKPFGIGELIARLRVVLRHTAYRGPEPTQIKSGGLRINFAKRGVSKNGVAVKLTPKEYDVLAMLAKHAGRHLTHRQILTAVWGSAHMDDIQYLRVLIAQLRAKIEEDPSAPRLVLTEFGVGYRFADLEQ